MKYLRARANSHCHICVDSIKRNKHTQQNRNGLTDPKNMLAVARGEGGARVQYVRKVKRYQLPVIKQMGMYWAA